MARPWRLGIPAVGLAAAVSLPAHALQQPDGTQIPVGGNLVAFLNAAGETIDPLTEAATTPETFTPGCALTFTVLGRGGSQKNSFGWYNVTGAKPAFVDLIEFIGCNDGVGTVRSLDIKSHPRYAGGDVGFFQATTQGHSFPNCVDFLNPGFTLGYVFYSEKAYNDDNTGPNSYIHLLTMNSKVIPNAFYFGWEDLYSGGDNDFEDLLTRVEGIQCSGGGEECPTGLIGECAFGALQCRNGVTECVQRIDMRAETCNGLDDDCNGPVDDGDLCPPGEICDRGTCVAACGTSEFVCPPNLVCRTDGYCVDPDCEDVMCPPAQVCVDGLCQGPCDGVVCPHGQVCRAGACVNPCIGVMCEPDQYCKDGVCIVQCTCSGCGTGTGEVCDSAIGQCVPTGCEGVPCAPGQHCEMGGACVDDCQGAVCPPGEKCESGACVDDPTAGTGGSSGTGVGGTFFSDAAGGAPGGSAGSGASVDGGGAGGSSSGGPRGSAAASDPGCGCRASGRAPASGIALFGALAFAARRRKRA